MANLSETPSYDAGVYQLELTDPVIGGPLGISNQPLKNLANRTAYLKQHVDDLESGTTAAAKADKLTTALTIALTGDVTGSAAFDGSANVSINAVVVDDSHNHSIATVNGLQPALDTKAPLASPGFTGNPTAPTPAQFDTDASLATTEFVQRALGNRAGVKMTSAATTLDASYAGQLTFITGTSYTLTLPATSGLPDGTALEFMTVASGVVTLACAGSDIFNFSNGFTSSSITLESGDTLVVVKRAGQWIGVGGTKQIGRSASFGASLSTNGFQRLPSGIIIQSGIQTCNAGATTTVIFPIAFPAGNVYHPVATCDQPAATATSFASCTRVSGSQMTISISSGSNIPVHWIAWGY